MHAIIPAAGSVIGGLISSRKSPADKALQASQTNNYNSQSELAKLFGQKINDTLGATQPGFEQAMQYYQSLLGGNRAASMQALAPEREQLADLYRGTTSSIQRNLTGALRQRELADANREQASKLADLLPAARRDAASTLYQGNNPTQLLSLFGQTGNLYGNAAATGSNLFRDDLLRRQQSAASGAALAKLLGNINWDALFGKKGAK